MENLFDNFIQIAGIIDKEETDLLLQNNLKFFGFPLRLPVNKEDLTEEEAKELIKYIKSKSAYPILITYQDNADDIIDFACKMDCFFFQLHGDISKNELEKLQKSKYNFTIIKSIIIKDDDIETAINKVKYFEPYVDAFITDSYNPLTGASGATGLTHNWDISKKIVEVSNKPVILAGGLNPDNVYDAILCVKPSGVDSHTGVESSDGRKSPLKIKSFIENAQKAFNTILK